MYVWNTAAVENTVEVDRQLTWLECLVRVVTWIFFLKMNAQNLTVASQPFPPKPLLHVTHSELSDERSQHV
jgi:hypothetical protein